MKCPPCIGQGHVIGTTNAPCPLCKGRGQLPDDRINNPECAACVGRGLMIGTTAELCPICGGWGRLPSETPEPLTETQTSDEMTSPSNSKLSKRTAKCLREKVENASVRDQLIDFLIFHRHRYPDQLTVHVDELLNYYKEVDLTPPPQQELQYALNHEGILSGYSSDTYGVESRLLNGNSANAKVIAPCLKMDLRIRFIDGYEHFVGKFRESYPVWYRFIFIVGICASFVSLYCLFKRD